MKEQMKKVAKSAVKSHEDKMHKGVKKMGKGGKTNEMMKTYGRGMAKVMNQRGR
jgi:hypothetical protein